MKWSDEKRKLTHGQIEFIIWLIVLLLLSFFIFYLYKKNENSYETHRIFLSDVDGLIVGSPVRIMGIQVGYINKIKIIGDEVYLRFIITDKSIDLPRGTVANVEFTGLAGSKSLELYAPEHQFNDSNVPIIIVEQPKRLHDSLTLLSVMYDKITSITYKFSYFGKKIIHAETEIDSNKDKYVQKNDLEDFMDYTDRWFESIKLKIKDFDKPQNDTKNKGAYNEKD